MYYVSICLSGSEGASIFNDLERLFEGFRPQVNKMHGGVDAFVDPEADVVPVFQIDGDVIGVMLSKMISCPSSCNSCCRDVAHGDRARIGVVGAALVRGEDDDWSARYFDTSRLCRKSVTSSVLNAVYGWP